LIYIYLNLSLLLRNELNASYVLSVELENSNCTIRWWLIDRDAAMLRNLVCTASTNLVFTKRTQTRNWEYILGKKRSRSKRNANINCNRYECLASWNNIDCIFCTRCTIDIYVYVTTTLFAFITNVCDKRRYAVCLTYIISHMHRYADYSQLLHQQFDIK